jgi:hypothetical protein
MIGLGFDVDDASLSKFNQAITTATKRVVGLSAAIVAGSAAVAVGVLKISDSFEDLGYQFRLLAPPINKALLLRNEMVKAYASAGVSLSKVAVQAYRLNISVEKTKIAFKALYQSVGSKFFGLITKQSDLFRNRIYANMPKIQHALESFVNVLFKAFEGVVALGERAWSILTRVYDFFSDLDKKTQGWSTIILGIVAAWELLNLTFLASPIGLLLAGLVAILALYDDFKKFQEGGKSFFNWGPVIPIIKAVEDTVSDFVDVWRSLVDTVLDVVLAFERLFQGDYQGFFDSLKDGFDDLGKTIKKEIEYILSYFDILGALGTFAKNIFTGNGSPTTATPGVQGSFGKGFQQIAQNIENNPIGGPLSTPLGAGNITNSSNTNQNVSQQTNINVIGTGDAWGTANLIAGQQGRVNQDLFNNGKGALR